MLSALPTLAPMLASAGPMPKSAEWAFELKLDGWRVLVYVDEGLDLRTRSGRRIGQSIPELAGLPASLHGHRVILDGELVAGQGRPDDFYRLGPRLSATWPAAVQRLMRRTPLTLAVFDLLFLDGCDLTSAPYDERRGWLQTLELNDRSWCTVTSHSSDGDGLLAACAELDLEGVVAKRLSSRYRPGARSKDWIKVKTPDWREQHAPLRHEARRR